jgi:myosin heavy subunit
LEIALQSAHNTIDEIRADNINAVAMRTQGGIQWEKEQKQLSLENQSLKEEIRILKNKLTQEVKGKDNATHSLEQQEFAFKDQVDRIQDEVNRLHAEREEHDHNFQQQQSDYQRRIDTLSQEKQELIRNTRNLQNQKSALTTQVEHLRQEKEQDIRTWQQKETTFQIQIQRRDEAVQRLTSVTQHLRESTRNIDAVTKTGTSKSPSGPSTKQKSSRRNQDQDLPSKVMKQAQNHMEDIQAASGNLYSHNQQPLAKQHNRTQKDRAPFQALDFDLHQQSFGQNLQQPQNITITRSERNDTQITQEASFDEETGKLQQTQQSHDETFSDAGSNLSSIVGHGFMADINQHLKHLKAAKRQLEAADQASTHEDTVQSGRSSHAPSVKPTAEHRSVRDDTIQTIQSGRSSHALSVKGTGGILKNSNVPLQDDFTGHFSVKSAKSNARTEQDHTSRSNTHWRHRSLVEEDHTTRSNTSHRRHHSETTIHTNARRQRDGDDMTSAYLVADIDAAKQGNNKDRPVLSATARQVLDGLCEHHHNRGNCTICLRLASFDTKSTSKKSVQIQKPIPVTKRPTSPVPYEEEVTLRPAVSPGLALATVLKGLEDELAHLKLKHSEVQKAYMEHDSSLGRRERKALKSEMDNILKKIEIKSDQIYALYDVLEGQAAAGQEMTQEMVDITMTVMSQHNLDVEEEELPWEGIEESD